MRKSPRRRVTPLFTLGALAMAAADAATALQLGTAESTGLGWLRLAGLLLPTALLATTVNDVVRVISAPCVLVAVVSTNPPVQ